MRSLLFVVYSLRSTDRFIIHDYMHSSMCLCMIAWQVIGANIGISIYSNRKVSTSSEAKLANSSVLLPVGCAHH